MVFGEVFGGGQEREVWGLGDMGGVVVMKSTRIIRK
jgi:hypothetical protein